VAYTQENIQFSESVVKYNLIEYAFYMSYVSGEIHTRQCFCTGRFTLLCVVIVPQLTQHGWASQGTA